MIQNLIESLRFEKELEPKDGLFCPQSSMYKPIKDPGGKFRFYFGDKTLQAINGIAGIDLNELRPLPKRIYDKCNEFGFLRPMPLHCMVDVQPAANQRNSGMTLTKMNNPMPMDNCLVDRSIVLFLPTILADIKAMKYNNAAVVQLLRGRGRDQWYAEDVCDSAAIIRAEMKMALSHEMVHAFATDEYFGMMDKLGLDLLELLTDAITVDVFYEDYMFESPSTRTGFTRGLAYLANMIRRERAALISSEAMVELMHQRAQKIIKKCQAILNPETEIVQLQA